MGQQLIDPDTAVHELGSMLKHQGWSWGSSRAGLGWAGKRIGLNKRKLTKLVVRVGVKGRRNGWQKGELSVQLYKATLLDDLHWNHRDPLRQRAAELCRDFTHGIITYRDVGFVAGIKEEDYKEIRDWLKGQLSEWLQEAEELAAQVEWLHEEHLRPMHEQTVTL